MFSLAACVQQTTAAFTFFYKNSFLNVVFITLFVLCSLLSVHSLWCANDTSAHLLVVIISHQDEEIATRY